MLCKIDIVFDLNLHDRVCTKCKYRDRQEGSTLCKICTDPCEYCGYGLPNNDLKGCGKKICRRCDEIRPYHICFLCKKMHREPFKMCNSCYDNRPDEPVRPRGLKGPRRTKDPVEIAAYPDAMVEYKKKLEEYNKLWERKCFGACSAKISGLDAICRCKY